MNPQSIHMSTEPSPRLSVLVVEDSVDAADSLALILELEGYRVAIANDGRSALESIERHPPSAILLDLGLPDIDGLEVARRVRDRFGPQVPLIIAISGHGNASDRSATDSGGFDDHLVKPVDPQVILELLGKRLGGASPPKPGTPFA